MIDLSLWKKLMIIWKINKKKGLPNKDGLLLYCQENLSHEFLHNNKNTENMNCNNALYIKQQKSFSKPCKKWQNIIKYIM